MRSVLYYMYATDEGLHLDWNMWSQISQQRLFTSIWQLFKLLLFSLSPDSATMASLYHTAAPRSLHDTWATWMQSRPWLTMLCSYRDSEHSTVSQKSSVLGGGEKCTKLQCESKAWWILKACVSELRTLNWQRCSWIINDVKKVAENLVFLYYYSAIW